MPNPLLLATWSFGLPAIQSAWPALTGGGSATDAAETACRHAEADPDNHTVGVGGWPDRDGQVSLDAAIMLAPDRAGAVCFARHITHPITVARAVMERTPHVLLAGAGADAFAAEQGFPPGELLTDAAAAHWQQWRQARPLGATAPAGPMANVEERAAPTSAAAAIGEHHHDTIGVLALDAAGLLAAGCTTSGLAFKLPGRVGDSPILGHGLYADPAAGACVCTGHGELVSGICGAFLAVETVRRGGTPLDAARAVLQRITECYALTGEHQIGVIVTDREGRYAAGSLRPGFQYAVATPEGAELRTPEFVAFPK